jgi:hypothetical protein
LSINTKNFNIIRSNNSLFKEYYSAFIEKYSQYSYKYNLSAFDYYESLSKKSKNHSFLFVSDDYVFACCHFVVEKIDDKYQGSLGNGTATLPSPIFAEELSKKQKRRAEKEVYEEFKRICLELDIDHVTFQSENISIDFNNLEDNLFARNGALDISGCHNIVDLKETEERIWEEQIRHSYKSIINRGYKHYSFKVYDQTNYTEKIGEAHRLLHHKCSGKVTRPLNSYKKMNSWIKQNNGLMFEQLYKDKTVQMILVGIGKSAAIGASAAEDPDVSVPCPLTHSMNHYIYLECKKRGIRYYDVGETTNRGNIFYFPNKKMLNISYFKSGFGKKYPLKKWIWFPTLEKEIEYTEKKFLEYKDYIKKEF